MSAFLIVVGCQKKSDKLIAIRLSIGEIISDELFMSTSLFYGTGPKQRVKVKSEKLEPLAIPALPSSSRSLLIVMFLFSLLTAFCKRRPRVRHQIKRYLTKITFLSPIHTIITE